MHSEDLCMASTKRKNCVDPNRSDSRKRLTRSTRAGKPTKEQLKNFRQAGAREYQAMIPAKIAEKRATIIERDMDIIAVSQSENIITENSQASSVEYSTDNAIRL